MSLVFSRFSTPGSWHYGLVALLLCLLGAAAAVLFLRRRRSSRFFYRFNALWDQRRDPYCPRCRTPLTDLQRRMSWKFENRGRRTHRTPISYSAFQCRKCSKQVRLVDEDGFELTLEKARLRLFEPPEEIV